MAVPVLTSVALPSGGLIERLSDGAIRFANALGRKIYLRNPRATELYTVLAAEANSGGLVSVASVIVSPTASTKAAAATQQLNVTATLTGSVTTADMAAGSVAAGVTYSSSDVTKATVSATGLVTAVATGTAVITVTYRGRTATYTMTIS